MDQEATPHTNAHGVNEAPGQKRVTQRDACKSTALGNYEDVHAKLVMPVKQALADVSTFTLANDITTRASLVPEDSLLSSGGSSDSVP